MAGAGDDERRAKWLPVHGAMSCSGCGKVGALAHGALGLVQATLGVGRTTIEVLRAREEACRGCPKLEPGIVWVARRCGICGCFMAAKLRLAKEVCPDDPPRWGRV